MNPCFVGLLSFCADTSTVRRVGTIVWIIIFFWWIDSFTAIQRSAITTSLEARCWRSYIYSLFDRPESQSEVSSAICVCVCVCFSNKSKKISKCNHVLVTHCQYALRRPLDGVKSTSSRLLFLIPFDDTYWRETAAEVTNGLKRPPLMTSGMEYNHGNVTPWKDAARSSTVNAGANVTNMERETLRREALVQICIFNRSSRMMRRIQNLNNTCYHANTT